MVTLLHGQMKPKKSELIESIEGYHFIDERILRIKNIKEHNTYLDYSIDFLDHPLDKMIEPYEPVIQL